MFELPNLRRLFRLPSPNPQTVAAEVESELRYPLFITQFRDRHLLQQMPPQVATFSSGV